MNVPYVSQIDNAPARNDCGPACVLILARWIDPASPLTVAGLAREIPEPRSLDPQDDGTTAANLEAGLRSAHLTPTRGAAAEYPYIALVTYNKLPRQNRYVEDIGIPHWIVVLGDGWYHDPYWPGALGAGLTASKAVLDAAERGMVYRVGILEVPAMAIDEGKAREPYGRVVHVIAPDATIEQAVAIFRMAWQNDRQTVSGSYDDAGIGSGLQSKRAVLHGIPAANRDSFKAFYAQWYPSTVVEFVDDGNAPPTPAPTIALTATPLAITAGQSSQLDWRTTNATAVSLNGEAVAAIGSRTVKPTATTQYTVRAVGSSVVTKSVTVGVTPVPPPPPTKAGSIGIHCIGDVAAGREAVNRGCPMVTVMSNYGVARELADRGVLVLYREYISWPHNGAQLAERVREAAGGVFHPRIIHLSFNECDNGLCYGTRDQLATRGTFDAEYKRLMRGWGAKVGIGGFSVGCPDYTDTNAPICATMQEFYAPIYNDDDPKNPGVFLAYHGYSARADDLLSLEGTTRALDTYATVAPDESRLERRLLLLGRDQHEAIVMVPKTTEERAITAYDPVWLETRFAFAYTKCGFRPDKLYGVVEDESGVDEGGVGGYRAHNYPADVVGRHVKMLRAVKSRPIVVNGKTYPSPWLGSTLFMYGEDQKWTAGFDCRPYADAIRAGVWA